jgi:hypothetical protein
VLLLAIASLLAACGRTTDIATEPGQGAWYVLRDGNLVSGRPTEEDGPETLLPWTVQERVVDLLVHDGTLVLAVNTRGIVTAPFPPGAPFTDRAEPTLFAGRTITEIFDGPEGLLVHMYVNRTLAGPHPPRGGPGLAFVRIADPAPSDGPTYLPIRPAFQAEHPDWEAVAVVRVSDTAYAVEWKRTDAERTEFFYTRYTVGAGDEEPMDQRSFRGAFGFKARSPDATTQALFQAAIRAVGQGAGRAQTAVHLVLRDGERTERLRYQPSGYARADLVDLVVVPARRAKDNLWALTPEGHLLGVAIGTRQVTVQSLPPLPQGYRYTAFVLSEADPEPTIAAAWEEVRFTSVGQAGLYVHTVRIPAP